MKKNILTVSALAFLFSLPAFAGGAKVKVDGMVCAFCAQGIKKVFGEKPAVESCEVDLDSKMVEVKFKKDKNMTDEEITNSIKEAGYNVHRLERFN